MTAVSTFTPTSSAPVSLTKRTSGVKRRGESTNVSALEPARTVQPIEWKKLSYSTLQPLMCKLEIFKEELNVLGNRAKGKS